MKDRIVDVKTIDARTGESFATYLSNETRTPAQTTEWKQCAP